MMNRGAGGSRPFQAPTENEPMVFPISDADSDRTVFPIVNVALIAINALVFVFLQGLGTNEDFTMAYSAVPAEIVTGRDLVTEDETVQVNTDEGPEQVVVPGLKKTPIPVYLTLLT